LQLFIEEPKKYKGSLSRTPPTFFDITREVRVNPGLCKGNRHCSVMSAAQRDREKRSMIALAKVMFFNVPCGSTDRTAPDRFGTTGHPVPPEN
jgi:hypothetical protein